MLVFAFSLAHFSRIYFFFSYLKRVVLFPLEDRYFELLQCKKNKEN